MALLKRFGSRLLAWLLQVLISIDQLGLLGVQLFTFVLAGRGGAPDADETISSKVGRNARKGARWALFCEAVIDRIFWIIAGQKNHCRDAIEQANRRHA